MSQTPTDPTAAGGAPAEPSEEEVRAYLAQLRSAPVDQLLAEALSSLLNAAQVKLGRRDGRLLLDGSAALTAEVRGALPESLRTQLDEVLSQLRLAQVQAEKEVAAAAAQGQTEENDVPEAAGEGGEADDAAASGSPDGAGAQPPPPADPGPSAASRLWVPGA